MSTRTVESLERQEVVERYGLADLEDLAPDDLIVEHDKIPFPSFPYEWPAEMLEAAARLTLDLAEALLKEGLGLKDGTPYNVLFHGSAPVFVDVLSVERRDPLDPIWLAYAQFVRTFLLPLAANRRFGLPLESVLLGRRDGFEPQEFYRLCGFLDRFRPPILTLVSLPVWLSSRKADEGLYRPRRARSTDEARFVLGRLLAGLGRQLRQVAPRRNAESRWVGYQDKLESYSAGQFAQKARFIESVLEEFRPLRVLDAGSNTGFFSLRAARNGAAVVAIDSDPVVAGRLWRQASSERLDVLPLAVNLAHPSPAAGWRNRECPAFLDRAKGAFDAVFLLAFLHHLLVTERIPLDETIDLAWQLTTDLAVIEFVGPDDPMFHQLVRGRDALYCHLTRDSFEAAARRRFHVVRTERLSGSSRWLYLLRKHGPEPTELHFRETQCEDCS